MRYSNKIKLNEDLYFNYQFKKGDLFTIIGGSQRGWDIKHDKTGRIIYECLMIHDKFEKITIKKERKEKLNKINKINES